MALTEESFFCANSSRHHREPITGDEEITTSLQNVIVITWFRLVHPTKLTQIKCWFLRRGEIGLPGEKPLGAE